MGRILLVHGLIAGAVIAIVSFGGLALMAGDDGVAAGSQWLGYTVMVIALSVIYFAVKGYRDDQQGGVIRFRVALKLGLGISLVAGAVYVLGWEIYFQATGGDFVQEYAASYLAQMRADGAAVDAISAARERMAEFEELYAFLPARIAITRVEILPVGVLISLLSAALLRKP